MKAILLIMFLLMVTSTMSAFKYTGKFHIPYRHKGLILKLSFQVSLVKSGSPPPGKLVYENTI